MTFCPIYLASLIYGITTSNVALIAVAGTLVALCLWGLAAPWCG